jgi:hypothetical protein
MVGVDGPAWMNMNGIPHMPVKYDQPSEDKAELDRRNELVEKGDVTRIMPIDKELSYMKYMEDLQELAKFDNYVEALVDPKAPGSADFLFKVYPEYVNRRMAQAQKDYEFALRNQMIDMWGINTFDDLYFKYMVDQGQITGPSLVRTGPNDTADDEYVSYNFLPARWRRKFNASTLNLPYTTSKIGSRTTGSLNRSGLPYSNTYGRDHAAGIGGAHATGRTSAFFDSNGETDGPSYPPNADKRHRRTARPGGLLGSGGGRDGSGSGGSPESGELET